MMYDSSSTLRYYYYHRCLEYTQPAFTGINVLAQRGSEGDVLGEVYHQHSMEWNENGKWQSHWKFLYNYIEELLFCALPSLQNDLIFQLTLMEAGRQTGRQTTKPKAERGMR